MKRNVGHAREAAGAHLPINWAIGGVVGERERLANLARDAYWREPNNTSEKGWLSVANAILADRRAQNVTNAEQIEARIEEADARAQLWEQRARESGWRPK